ncbi:MAG: hypothetical protein D6725_06735 [Planctomycetota bacterium]|nr:MAG: hypothetical protein D6725_06735 [Planctomycetota bacterium]
MNGVGRVADLSAAAARLTKALDYLDEVWAAVREEWDDENSRAFAEEHLEPLASSVRSALDAVNRMNDVLAQAERDCSDPERGA